MARPVYPSDPSASSGHGSSGQGRDSGALPVELSPVPAPNWPGAVRVPGSPGFERSAKSWLFDLAPPRCQYEEILHRRPAELARLVRLRLESDIVAMHAGLKAVREGHMAMSSRGAADIPYLTDLYTRERDWACDMLDQVKLVEKYLKKRRRPAGPRAHSPLAQTGHAHLPLPPGNRAAG